MPRTIFSVCLLALSLGCGQGSEPLDPMVQTFSALEEERFVPRIITDPGPQVMAEEATRVKAILDGFERNADELLSRGEIASRLGVIESAYVVAGRYFELVALYQRHVETHGTASHAAPRLVWSWLRLGQEQRAGKLAEQLLIARPEDPIAWFLQGAYWVRYAANDAQIARNVIMAWKKTLALDPMFVGYDDIDAAALRQEIDRMNASIKLSDEDAIKLASAHIAKLQGARPAQPPTAPQDAQPPAAPDAPPVVAQPTPPPAPLADAPPTPQQDAPLALTLARAQLAADSNRREQAIGFLRAATRQHLPGPDLAAAIEAQGAQISAADLIALLELSWRLEQDRPGVARATRTLAKRPALTGPQLWSLALFSLRQLEDRTLTGQLLDRLDKEHPDDAKRLHTATLRKQL
jgi:tetratricopeptide (TPR) repeat protein